MTDTLLHAYLPLLLWTGLGLLILPVLPNQLPRLLGRGLYWVGVPLQVFTLARQTEFAVKESLVPVVVAIALISGLLMAWLSLQLMRSLASQPQTELPHSTLAQPWQDAASRGSFVLSAMLGNTGFVGLAVAPSFVDEQSLGWLVLFSILNNVAGTYGVGVVLASFYGRSPQQKHWWIPLRDLLTVPSLWAFGAGLVSRSFALPGVFEAGLHLSLSFIIPSALLLMGIRLRQIKGWQSLRRALVPTIIKVVLLPLAIAAAATLLGLNADPRLALVIMAGMPTAFAGLILAEEYELDRDLIASSIVLTTGLLFLTIPLWLWLFDQQQAIAVLI